MSMAVVCVNVSWLVPSATIASKAKSYNVASSSSACLVFRPQRCGSQTRYSSLVCRASSGGSRRDHEKILARQKNRRVRHMKGVTPSTPDLIGTLESEKRDQAKLDSRLDSVNGDGVRRVRRSGKSRRIRRLRQSRCSSCLVQSKI